MPDLTTLTTYLTDWTITDIPKHGVHPSIKNIPNMTICPKNSCGACSENTNHPTYCRGKLTAQIPQANLPRPSRFRNVQWLLSRLDALQFGLYGKDDGYYYNGSGSLNFYQSVTLYIELVDDYQITAYLPDNSDPRNICVAQSRYVAEGENSYTTHSQQGSISPNMFVRFPFPSALENKVKCQIVKIDGYEVVNGNNCIKFTVDHLVNSATGTSDNLNLPPQHFTVEIGWYCVPEPWVPVLDGYNRWMYKISKVINVTDIPSDGRILLKDETGADCLIAPPYTLANGGKTFLATAKVAATRVDWGAILATRIRLEITSVANGVPQGKTWLCLRTTDFDGSTNSQWTDLVEQDLRYLVLVYHPSSSAKDEANKYRVDPTGGRCLYSCRDYSNSDYDQTSGTELNGSERWYCSKRRYDVITQDEGAETVEWKQPTGIGHYTKQCQQYGTCDCYIPLMDGTTATKPFSIANCWNAYFKQVWANIPIKLTQMMVGLPYYTVSRVGTPSLRSLAGGYALNAPYGMHETTLAPHYSTSTIDGVGTVTTQTVDGDTTLALSNKGFAYNILTPITSMTFDSAGTFPSAGYIASAITGFSSKLNPIDYASTETDYGAKYYEPRTGFRLEHDSYSVIGRDQPDYSHALGASETLYCEHKNHTIKDTWQPSTGAYDCRIKFFTSPVSIADVDYGAVIEVAPWITTGKTPLTSVVTGTVSSVTALGNNQYKLEIVNQSDNYSYVSNKSDVLVPFKSGGGFAGGNNLDWYQIISYYSNRKSFGSSNYKCYKGDSVRFPNVPNYDGLVLSERQYVVTDTKAFGGSAALDWGDEHAITNTIIDGYYIIDADSPKTPDGIAVISAGNYGTASVYMSITSNYNNTCINSNCILKNTRTGEYAWTRDVINNSGVCQIELFNRGIYASTAANIVVGDTWVLEKCFLGDSLSGTVFTEVVSVTRPATLAMGEYWIDYNNGSWHFSQDDKFAALNLHYHIVGESLFKTNLKQVVFNVPQAVAETGIAWGNQGFNKVVSIPAESLTLTLTAGTPSRTQYQMVENAGTIDIIVNNCHSGKILHTDINTGYTLTYPTLEVAYCPNFTTWGKKRDYITITDPSGVFPIYPTYVGETIVCDYGKAVLAPESVSVWYSKRGFNTWNLLTTITEAGNGRIWITKASIDSMVSALGSSKYVCFKLM